MCRWITKGEGMRTVWTCRTACPQGLHHLRGLHSCSISCIQKGKNGAASCNDEASVTMCNEHPKQQAPHQ
jgi:hypothetical protein